MNVFIIRISYNPSVVNAQKITSHETCPVTFYGQVSIYWFESNRGSLYPTLPHSSEPLKVTRIFDP